MSQLFVYDFTLSLKHAPKNAKGNLDVSIIVKELQSVAKRWSFQEELSDPFEEETDVNENGDFLDGEWEEPEEEDDGFGFPIEENIEMESLGDESLGSDFTLDSYNSNSDSDTDDSEFSTDTRDSQGRYPHLQGKCSLYKKVSKSTLLKMMYDAGYYLAKAHWSGSSNNAIGNLFYTTKLHSRVAGPWTNLTWEEPGVVPKQFKTEIVLKPWQQDLKNLCDKHNRNDRQILYIYQKEGNVGKSFWSLYMATQKLATIIPPFNNMNDIMGAMMGQNKLGCYIIDMPRGLGNMKIKLNEFYSGIECAKNQYIYDKRFSYKFEILEESPTIVVFSNSKPQYSMISKDRWLVMSIVNDELLLLNGEKPFIKEAPREDEEDTPQSPTESEDNPPNELSENDELDLVNNPSPLSTSLTLEDSLGGR